MSARHGKREGFASGIGGIGREKACFAAWRFRHGAFARRRGSRVIVVAGIALWLGGCGTIPSANLVATPSPRADPSCRVQLPAVVATGTDGPSPARRITEACPTGDDVSAIACIEGNLRGSE
ncbi:hypothetical protein ACOCG7_34060 (plasmid) [Paraburkholderia sp. DD10]|uniref:hypothetical protein n=1 Tax=Paraburkholderia sp. DD10 TaxID=3409691 RepID=UPI003BA08BD2